MEPVFTPTPVSTWYKRPSGIILLCLLVLIVLAGIGFVGMVGYYSLKINQGEEQEFTREIGGLSKDARLANTNAPKAVTTGDILSVISSDNPSKGKETAPVTIVMFIDFECPYSKSSHDIFNQLLKQYGSSIKVIFKHFPISSIHPQATNAALAASCAHEQKKFWEYYDVLFNEETLTDETYEKAALSVRINMNQFRTCYTTQKNLKTIEEDVQNGITLGVQGTPTYFVNAQKIEGVPTLEQWNTIILKEMKK